jgi:hypothetical protein
MAVQRIRFDAVRAQLDAAIALCDDLQLGMQARRGRFAEYRRTIVAAVDGVHAGRPVPSGLDERRDAVALIESQLLGALVPFLRTCPPDIVAAKLEVVLAGPALPGAESPTSNHARNVMFELSMGFSPHFPDDRVARWRWRVNRL